MQYIIYFDIIYIEKLTIFPINIPGVSIHQIAWEDLKQSEQTLPWHSRFTWGYVSSVPLPVCYKVLLGRFFDDSLTENQIKC